MLNDVDSPHIRYQYGLLHHIYKTYFELLSEGEGSPFKDNIAFTFSEFIWAFSTVLNRTLQIHNYDIKADPDFKLIIMPLYDFLNHSPKPNVGVMPYHEEISDRSFFNLVALKNIKPEEQLTVNYGSFSNTEWMVKYGFTIDSPEQKQLNFIAPFYPYGNYEQIVLEE